MKILTSLFLAAPLLAGLSENPVSTWGIQLGVARSTSNNPSLDGQKGVDLEFLWSRPFTTRPDIQARAGFTSIDGKPFTFIALSNSWPPVYLGEGTAKAKINTQFIGLDYRVRWFRGSSTPYFVIGIIGANVDYSESSTLNGNSYKFAERGLKGGVSWGFGYLFGNKIGIDLRGHGYNAQNSASSFVLGASYRF